MSYEDHSKDNFQTGSEAACPAIECVVTHGVLKAMYE
jgi:hypothetical protein